MVSGGEVQPAQRRTRVAKAPSLQSVADIHCPSAPEPQNNLRPADGETGHRESGAPPRLHSQQTVEQIDSSSGVPLNHPPPCLAEKAIYRFLEGAGPCKALIIARALGMKTAREVNPHLYDMRKRHLVSLDEKSSLWSIYRPGRSLPPAPR